MTNLQRFQIYLDPDDVATIDKIASGMKIKRSQILRDMTSAAALVAERYIKVMDFLRSETKKQKNPLLDLIGIEESKTGTVGLNVDEIYQDD